MQERVEQHKKTKQHEHDLLLSFPHKAAVTVLNHRISFLGSYFATQQRTCLAHSELAAGSCLCFVLNKPCLIPLSFPSCHFAAGGRGQQGKLLAGSCNCVRIRAGSSQSLGEGRRSDPGWAVTSSSERGSSPLASAMGRVLSASSRVQHQVLARCTEIVLQKSQSKC